MNAFMALLAAGCTVAEVAVGFVKYTWWAALGFPLVAALAIGIVLAPARNPAPLLVLGIVVSGVGIFMMSGGQLP